MQDVVTKKMVEEGYKKASSASQNLHDRRQLVLLWRADG